MKLFVKLIAVMVGMFSTAHAGEVGTVSPGYTTSSSPLTASIAVTPSPNIRFRISGMNVSGGGSNVSTAVDKTTVSVTAGASANEIFKDDATQATYYGYYLSSGVASTNQDATLLQIKIKKGTNETPGRSFYILGNGTSHPKKESDLIRAPSTYSTFASAGTNSTHCGPNYRANHLVDGIRCDLNTTVPNMDITQFVKVLHKDPNPSTIISQLEFVVMPN